MGRPIIIKAILDVTERKSVGGEINKKRMIQTDGQTDRQTDRQANRQRQTDRLEREMGREGERDRKRYRENMPILRSLHLHRYGTCI